MHTDNTQFLKLDKVKYPLVNQFYKRVYKKGMASKGDSVFVLQDTDIICSAKLKQLDTYLILTGVACDPQYRGKGYATHLLTKLLSLHTETIYCFPYRYLSGFYEQLGFIEVSSNEVPLIISERFNKYNPKNTLRLLIKQS